MPFEANKTAVNDFIKAFNQGDSSAVKRSISPNFYNYQPKTSEPTAQQVLQGLVGDMRQSAPDLQLSVGNFVGEGEELTFSLTLTGTRTNNLWGAPGSGKKATWTSTVSSRFEDGKFAFCWKDLPVPEILAVLRQIDLVPPPDQMDQPLKHQIIVPEFLLKLLFTGQVADKSCQHLDQIKVKDPATDVCDQCVAQGDNWPALRMCLVCGFVGCCDTSKNKHMKQHYEETGHPIFRSIRLSEGWVWCYEDDAFFTSDILDKVA